MSAESFTNASREQPTRELPSSRGYGRAGWAQASIVLDDRAVSVRKWGQPADFGDRCEAATGSFFEIGRQSPFSFGGMRDVLGRCGSEGRAS